MSEDNQKPFAQDLTHDIAREFLREQRTARRWGIFFKLLFALYVLGFLVMYAAQDTRMGHAGLHTGQFTALVDIDGVIASDNEASADNIVTGLREAFEDKNTAGVILRINSPGGSPVQAGYVNDEIGRLRKKYPATPLYVVISDICASGGYYIAVAGDRIYADKASVVGSIGVIMSGFGFVDAIHKLGIERRIRHAGRNKALLDPFSPLQEDEVEHVDGVLNEVYQQFINVVKKGRGKKLADDPRIFTGLIWTGEEAVKLGLVDALGSAGYVAREVIGAEDIVDFTYRQNFFDRVAHRFATAMADRLFTTGNLQLR